MPLVGQKEGMKAFSKTGGKWKVERNSTVREERGAWLLEKKAVVRARLRAMLSTSPPRANPLFDQTPRGKPVRSTTAIDTKPPGRLMEFTAPRMAVLTSAALSGSTVPKSMIRRSEGEIDPIPPSQPAGSRASSHVQEKLRGSLR
jgi:hypothetical protein